jgi:(R,R)-butanediol dehydrogenase / meso-butanediol dehydrogenase / diacetyl reductase
VKALVHRGPKKFVIEERAEPRPGPLELLLRPSYVGLCITDRHVYDGAGFGPPWPEGLVIGHEFSAVVQEVGADVDGWAPGDRVAVDPRLYCRECPNCRAGLSSLCERSAGWIGVGDGRDGAFADLVVAPEYGCFKLPDHLADGAAGLAEPAACATRSVRLSGLAVDDQVLFVGADDYALLALQRVRHTAADVVVMDPADVRRRAAKQLGATLVLDPSDRAGRRALRELMARGADVVFVSMEDYVEAATGYLRLAFSSARVQGTVVVLRTYGGAPYAAIAPEVPYMKELTIRHFGAFFGEEPLRGGRRRGDWSVGLDSLASREIERPPETVVVDFDDLRGEREVREFVELVPNQATKVLVRVGGDRQTNPERSMPT